MAALCGIINKYSAPFGIKALSGPNASTHAIQRSDPQESTLVPRLQSSVVQPQPQIPALPLPSVYGIYALSNGDLYELEALPGRVPDPRVFMSTPVQTPSRTVLPDGRIAFIVFRRDMTVSAPDRVAVRVIAKVTRGMTFNTAGRASTTSLDDQWAIRSTSYDLRAAPVSDKKCCCSVPKTPILCSRLAVMDLCSRGRPSISALTVQLLNLLSASSVSQQPTETFILNVGLPERPPRDRPRSLHDRSCPPRVIIPSTGRKGRLTGVI